MFESCNSIEELNRERLELIRSGNPSVLVNKEYAKKKALLLSNQDKGFKKLHFIGVPVIESTELLTGISNAWWEPDEPYRMYIEEA